MIRKLLCKIGLHNNLISFNYYPSIDADIVTSGELISICRLCGRKEMVIFDYINEIFVKAKS